MRFTERLSSKTIFLAPMAGVTDAAYRMVARGHGADLAYTEMVSVAGIHYRSEKTWELVMPHADEPDIAVQLFGSSPDQFEEAAFQVAERVGEKLACIDINMACPVPKVIRKGEGSALMDDPDRAAQIVRAARRGVGDTVDVTVKIRRGHTAGEELAPAFAQVMEDAGAAAIAVHGRFASQLYRGAADWSCVERVADAVDIPVIGSGDLLTAATVARVLAEGRVSSVMVARGSYGNPWIFEDAKALLGGRTAAEHDAGERLDTLEEHIGLLVATGAHLARARSLFGWYMKGLPHAAELRARGMACTALEDYLALIANARSWLS